MGGSAPTSVMSLSARELLALARRRLAEELAELPEWKTAAFWRRLRTDDLEHAVSLGVLAHCVRRAAADDDAAASRELFTLLIERIERRNLRWAAQVVASTAMLSGGADAARDDLMQELALYLWQRLRRGEEQWELFFPRVLVFAQRHVAAAYMQKRGLWPRAGVRRSARISARFVASLSALSGEDVASEPPDEVNPLAAAELADLRLLVLNLPVPERVAVVLRFWQGASEAEIARALGGVTTRTVRNVLRRAYIRLRAAYEGAEVRT